MMLKSVSAVVLMATIVAAKPIIINDYIISQYGPQPESCCGTSCFPGKNGPPASFVCDQPKLWWTCKDPGYFAVVCDKPDTFEFYNDILRNEMLQNEVSPTTTTKRPKAPLVDADQVIQQSFADFNAMKARLICPFSPSACTTTTTQAPSIPAPTPPAPFTEPPLFQEPPRSLMERNDDLAYTLYALLIHLDNLAITLIALMSRIDQLGNTLIAIVYLIINLIFI